MRGVERGLRKGSRLSAAGFDRRPGRFVGIRDVGIAGFRAWRAVVKTVHAEANIVLARADAAVAIALAFRFGLVADRADDRCHLIRI